jgi:hypothetical protein
MESVAVVYPACVKRRSASGPMPDRPRDPAEFIGDRDGRLVIAPTVVDREGPQVQGQQGLAVARAAVSGHQMRPRLLTPHDGRG